MGGTTRCTEGDEPAALRNSVDMEAEDDEGSDFDACDSNGVECVMAADSDKFKRCPLVAAVVEDAARKASHCLGHGIKNVCRQIGQLVCDIDKHKFAQARRIEEKCR